jgi:hypothetical protein
MELCLKAPLYSYFKQSYMIGIFCHGITQKLL